MAETIADDGGPLVALVGVRRLSPADTKFFEGTFSLLHCFVKDQGLFRGVFAVRLFPVRHPDRFISLHYTDAKDKEHEIGVIEDLAVFPDDAREMVQASLDLQYCERIVRRIHEVRSEHGVLFFDVETRQGRMGFVMPWRGDRAEDYGDGGKVLLDAYDNRFIIPDVNALPSADRRRFSAYIYW